MWTHILVLYQEKVNHLLSFGWWVKLFTIVIIIIIIAGSVNISYYEKGHECANTVKTSLRCGIAVTR